MNELRAWAKSKLNFEPSDLHRRCSAGFLRVKINNLDCELMQISAIYFPTFFQKTDCTIFALSVCQSVGWSVSVTINFPSPNCVTQPHTDKIPPFTIHYHSLLTQCHHVLQILSKHQNTNERFALFTGSSLIIESSLHLYWHSVYLASASFHPHYNHGFHHRQSN